MSTSGNSQAVVVGRSVGDGTAHRYSGSSLIELLRTLFRVNSSGYACIRPGYIHDILDVRAGGWNSVMCLTAIISLEVFADIQT